MLASPLKAAAEELSKKNDNPRMRNILIQQSTRMRCDFATNICACAPLTATFILGTQLQNSLFSIKPDYHD